MASATQPSIKGPDFAEGTDADLRTLDLAELARIGRGERVEVRGVRDHTLTLFAQTLALVRDDTTARDVDSEPEPVSDKASRPPAAKAGAADLNAPFVPEHEDLRSLFFLAEALGGYEALHDLFNAYSPGNTLSEKMRGQAQESSLLPGDVEALRNYQRQIHAALRSAHAYLRDTAGHDLSRQELRQLHDVILSASDRSKDITRILGMHLIHEVEQVVARLNEIRETTRHVEHTVDGIFLVNSEVLYIPADELIKLVTELFEAVGNSYFARHVDGVLLLAARNLIIDVAAFHAYYGKHQIYNLLSKGGSNVGVAAVTARIRREIRKLFETCQQDNRLVLTRVMQDAQREFELSVSAIQAEAERSALDAVQALVPSQESRTPPRRRSLFKRLLSWLWG